MKHIAIYHSPCQDGLTAAWVFNKYMTEAAYDCRVVPGTYGSENVYGDLTKNDIVYFLDYTLPRAQMLEVAKKVSKVIVIDHHISAQKALIDMPSNVELHFDIGRSGAVLAWQHFYPGIDVPSFLLYIEDYDIWANKLVGTHEFFAWFTARNPRTIIELNNLIADFPETVDAFLDSRQYRHGTTVMQYRQILIDFILEKPVFVTLDGVEMVKFNCPLVQINAYVGKQAVAKYGKPSWIWSEVGENGKIVVRHALRSDDSLADVSLIAVKHGGGGHRNAAGFAEVR